MIIKRLYSSQEVVEGLHLVWDVFIRENANSCTQQGIEEFARFIKMENFMPLVESGDYQSIAVFLNFLYGKL